MAGIHGLLQLMSGRHYMKINTWSFSGCRWQEQKELDAKEQGAGLILLLFQLDARGESSAWGERVHGLPQNRQEDSWYLKPLSSPLHHTVPTG